jgi:hypothetical protein
MSYWVSLGIDTGRTYDDNGVIKPDLTEVWSENYTSNCSPMWRKAGANLREMDGMPARDAAPVLAAAVDAMRADPESYRAMNPENGWGDYATAMQFLASIHAVCVEHPLTTLQVSS